MKKMKVERLCFLMACESGCHSAEIDFDLPDGQISAGLPDKLGITLKGRVIYEEKGVAEVVVFNGLNVTVTDEQTHILG